MNEIGIIFSHIVGLRHYNVPVVQNEKIEFRRDTENKHDLNAIAALNKHGQKLGFLPRHASSILAPLIDKNWILIRGIVYGIPTERNVPVAVEVVMLENGKSIISRKSGNSKEAIIHNDILEIFLNFHKYTSSQLRGLRTFYSALVVMPETKLIHKLLEYRQLTKTT